ncbi:MAG: DUF3467 domain-containing protein [Desulfomonile tiedjei]|nr:DUF3467 domain-containing protein [Desulfomonile tiedjei]
MNGEDQKTEQAETAQPQAGPAKMMSNQLAVYYTNCAMVATSPRDISLFFGRYVPTADEKGGQRLVELYERQIYMTLEQAEDLAKILAQTVEVFKGRRTSGT